MNTDILTLRCCEAMTGKFTINVFGNILLEILAMAAPPVDFPGTSNVVFFQYLNFSLYLYHCIF